MDGGGCHYVDDAGISDRFNAQLLGLPAAENLLSRAGVDAGDIWLTMVGEPMTAAEVCSEFIDVPLGSFRNNRPLS